MRLGRNATFTDTPALLLRCSSSQHPISLSKKGRCGFIAQTHILSCSLYFRMASVRAPIQGHVTLAVFAVILIFSTRVSSTPVLVNDSPTETSGDAPTTSVEGDETITANASLQPTSLVNRTSVTNIAGTSFPPSVSSPPTPATFNETGSTRNQVSSSVLNASSSPWMTTAQSSVSTLEVTSEPTQIKELAIAQISYPSQDKRMEELAVPIAEEAINADPALLAGYRLRFVFKRVESCEQGAVVNATISAMHDFPNVRALIGPHCLSTIPLVNVIILGDEKGLPTIAWSQSYRELGFGLSTVGAVFLVHVLIPKTIGNRKRDCA